MCGARRLSMLDVMHTDGTLHFPHPLTHPSVVYAPTHLVDHAIPLWAWAAFFLAVILAVCAFIAMSLLRWRGCLAMALASCVLLGCAAAGNATKGEYVGPLSRQDHDLGLGQPDEGDQPQLYVKRSDALAAATEVSKGQNKPAARARATAYAWGKWPSTALNTAHPPYDVDDFPNDAGWTKDDADQIDTWVSENYDVSPGGIPNGNEDHTHFGVRAPDGSQPEVDGDSVAEVSGDELAWPCGDEDGQTFVCSVQMSALKLNDLSQPVSATPKQLVCVLKDQQTADHPHLYYPAKKH